MERLPDLSEGTLTRALQSAREGNASRAAWALAAAERLDPGRPETAFATAKVARIAGDYGGAISAHLHGWRLLFASPVPRAAWLRNLILFLVALAVIAGLLFVALQMAVKGPALIHDLMAMLHALPHGIAFAVALVLLVWPLVLPGGVAWLPLYWSALLWAYSTRSERIVLAVGWLVVAASPMLVMAQGLPVRAAIQSPMRAAREVAAGRLYGAVFSDLGALRSRLPKSPAVTQLLGDVHRRLGQWENGQNQYQKVLEKEPENVTALIDVGAYHFRRGDFGNAVQFFQQAASADSASAAAYYNLSLAYSEAYLFDDATSALQQAQQIDNDLVSSWIQRGEDAGVLTFDGGYDRVDEIGDQLAALPGPESAAGTRGRLRRWLSLAAVVVAVGLAFAFSALRTRLVREPSNAVEDSDWRMVRFLLPTRAAADGRGLGALLMLLLPATALAYAFVDRYTFAVPWGLDPGRLLGWILLGIAALALYGWRLRLLLRGDI